MPDAGTSEKPNYKKTLSLLSKGEAEKIFPQRANLVQREPEMLKFWEKTGIYEKLREQKKDKPAFILHDGPPYANGRIHLGHVLNKVLKDITIRSRALGGKDIPFNPGWDCHGLPIEHKVMQEVRAKGEEVGTFELRRRCRNYALKFIKIMEKDFKRLGVFAHWEKPYRTLDPTFEGHELRLFATLVEKGMVYRNLKPVYWCPSYETALAEAEVEYQDHTSPSIYVKFPSIDVEEVIGDSCGDTSKPLSVLIWTTTPWTLPANLAISLHPRFEYVVMETEADRMLLARELAERVAEEAGITDYTLHDAPRGDAFENKKCKHPFLDKESLLINGEHVTLEAGSGCVHTAPGHGHDDYLIGLKYGLEVYSPVNAKGCFGPDFPEFEGIAVEDANQGIIDLMKANRSLLFDSKITHSYPHDWREKKPVIFRATPQWFISLERANLRDQLLAEVDQVDWIPKWGKDRISAMLDNRVEWCISRQRAWGVPIPAIHLKESDESILDPDFIRKFADLVAETGVDVWYQQIEGADTDGASRLRDLVEETLKGKGLEGEWYLDKDTLDVWFDSGSSHHAVLNEDYGLPYPADLYLEGSDQHRGWFQSSLTNAVAIGAGAPYKAVLTHGFLVDEKGEKLSKTKGNYIEANEAVQEYGADILRLWVSSEDFRGDMSVSKDILKQRMEAYRRFRNTFRFILTAISDFTLDDIVPEDELLEIDRYFHAKWVTHQKNFREAYENYEFHRVYHLANNFCTVDLSARYLDILKDRLYTFKKDGHARRSAQTVLLEIMKGLVQSMSPVISFTSEEAWQSLKRLGLADEESVALTEWSSDSESVSDDLVIKWDWLFDLRDGVNAAIEPKRQAGEIGQSLQASVDLWFKSEAEFERATAAKSLPSGSDLASALIVSEVNLHHGDPEGETVEAEKTPGVQIGVKPATGHKCVRCWRVVQEFGSNPDHPEICDRCLEAITE